MSRLTHDQLAASGPSAPHERTYVVLTGAGSSPATVARLRAQLSWRDDLFVDLTTSFVVDGGEEPVPVLDRLGPTSLPLGSALRTTGGLRIMCLVTCR